MQSGGAVRDWAALFTRRQSEDMSVLAQDYPSAPANPSSLAKRDARGWRGGKTLGVEERDLYETNRCSDM